MYSHKPYIYIYISIQLFWWIRTPAALNKTSEAVYEWSVISSEKSNYASRQRQTSLFEIPSQPGLFNKASF